MFNLERKKELNEQEEEDEERRKRQHTQSVLTHQTINLISL